MYLNWSTTSILQIIVLMPFAAFLIMSLYNFLSQKHKTFLYMTFAMSFLLIFGIFRLVALLFVRAEIMDFLSIPFMLFIVFTILYIDSMSRESIDPVKLLIVVVGILCVLFEVIFRLPTEEVFSQAFYVIGLLIWIIFGIQIHRAAPKNFKFYSLMNLIGALIIALSSIFFTLLYWLNRQNIISIVSYDPMVMVQLIVGWGFIPILVAFAFKPSLAYVLPFKALRLAVVDMTGGIPLFTHTWVREEKVQDELLFGMLQGVAGLMQESIKRGELQEIVLDEATLIIQRNIQYNIMGVLVTIKSSRSLRSALHAFLTQFLKRYEKELIYKHEISRFIGASDTVKQCFPHTPEYIKDSSPLKSVPIGKNPSNELGGV